MEPIKIGTKVKSLGINRFNCAVGVKSRAILIDPNPRMKYLAFDQERKRKVEVNQDLMIKYGLRPYAAFFYLVARLNTDMKGRIMDSDYVIEFIQLSENLQNDFADAVEETPDFNSLTISKVEKRGPQGQDFSHLKVKPSSFNEFPEELLAKIEELRSNQDAIEKMWSLVDASTSISAEEYIKLVESGDSDSRPTQRVIESAAPDVKQIAQETTEFAQGNDFDDLDETDDFN